MKRPLCTGCLFFLIIVWLGLRWLGPPENPYREQAGEAITLTGVVEWKEEKNGKQIFYLKDVRFSDGRSQEKTGYERNAGRLGVICTLPEDGILPPLGSVINVRGRVSLYRNATNPGEFDLQEYYLYKGYGAKAAVQEWSFAGEHYDRWKEDLWQLRCFLGEIYDACLPAEDAGVMKAMVLGDKGELSSDIKDLYRVNGIAHILAISGLHISILGIGFYKGLRKATVPILPAAAVALFLIVNYAMLTGASTSTVRAVIMFGLMAGADVERRSYDLPTALALSAASTVFFSPYEIMLSAFWMSYTAVAGIAIFYPAVIDGIRFGRDLRGRLLAALSGSLAVSVFTLPLILLNYYETPVYSVLLNLVVIPLMSVLMVSGLLVLLLGSLWLPAGVVIGMPCHLVLKIYTWLCQLLQRLPYHTCIAGCPSVIQMVLAYLFFGTVFLLGRRMIRKLAGYVQDRDAVERWYGQLLVMIGGDGIYAEKEETDLRRLLCWRCGLAACGVLVLFIHFRPQVGVTFLDVGQGDGICFESPDLTVMIDGGSTSKDALFQYQIEPFLKYRGIGKVDYWFITHPDTDHCSGLTEMLAEGSSSSGKTNSGIAIGAIVLPDAFGAEEDFAELISLAEAHNIPVLWNAAGSVLQGEQLHFVCLHPASGYRTEDVNTYSQVLEVSGGGFTGIFTGDATVESEEVILRTLGQNDTPLSRPVDGYFCLKLGHHGSHTSSSQAFLDFVSPQIAIVSCGYHNSYGHPHADVMERVGDLGCDVFRTDEDGAIMIRATNGRIRVECFHDTSPGK